MSDRTDPPTTAVAERPAIEGWFVAGERPHLVGQRCTACGTVQFPPRAVTCPSPRCTGEELESVPLSRRGTVWSYATNHYPPPAPYVPDDPFTPVTIAAVELAEERLVVLGQVAGDTSQLRVGAPVELEIGTLFATDEERRTVWRWRVTDAEGPEAVSEIGSAAASEIGSAAASETES